MRYKMNRAVVELVKDDRDLVFVEIKLFAVKFLEGVFFCAVQKPVDGVGEVVVADLGGLALARVLAFRGLLGRYADIGHTRFA